MSQDISAKLIVGLHFKDMQGFIDTTADPEDSGLQYACPHYDGHPKTWVYGIEIQSTEDNDPVWIGNSLVQAQAKFKEITGMEGKLHLCVHVS